MAEEHYKYSLHASAGWIEAKLTIHNNNDVECELHHSAMGDQGYHYRLYGKLESHSDAYGWIHMHRVEDVRSIVPTRLPIEALAVQLIFEYVKLPRSPLLQHPEDMLWLAARWTESFDLILFTSRFVWECLDSLEYAIAEGILEETHPPSMVAHIDEVFIEHLTTLLDSLDNMKFAKIDNSNHSLQQGT